MPNELKSEKELSSGNEFPRIHFNSATSFIQERESVRTIRKYKELGESLTKELLIK